MVPIIVDFRKLNKGHINIIFKKTKYKKTQEQIYVN